MECCIIQPCLVLFGCNIKIKIMSGNINGSQLDCSTRGDRLGLLSLHFLCPNSSSLSLSLSLQRSPCGNIRQNDPGFVYLTPPSDCCSSFCWNTNGNKIRRSLYLIMLLFLSFSSGSSQMTDRPVTAVFFASVSGFGFNFDTITSNVLQPVL